MFGLNGGRWLNTYQLPYYGTQYLLGAENENWTVKGSQGFYGKGFGQLGQLIGINFPSTPEFQPKMKSSRQQISTAFYLINKNNQWLIKNYQFIHAFFAGTNWLHLPFCIVRPPNVYHVLCPGKFQIYWAAMDISITFEGKLRTNPIVSTILRHSSKAIDESMLWPQAWKVEVTLTDLCPSNFNVYAEYFQNGYNQVELHQIQQNAPLISAVVDAINYIGDSTSQIISVVATKDNDAERKKNQNTEVVKKVVNKMAKTFAEIIAPNKDNKTKTFSVGRMITAGIQMGEIVGEMFKDKKS